MRAIDAVELKMSIAVSALVEDQKTLEQIIDEQPTIEPEPHWIPCSERLPDSRRSVLITVSNGKDYETCEAYYHELRKDWFEVNGDRVCEMSPRWKTIAWCELPEPYKGEQE